MIPHEKNERRDEPLDREIYRMPDRIEWFADCLKLFRQGAVRYEKWSEELPNKADDRPDCIELIACKYALVRDVKTEVG
jgi:hypothetical protein